MAFSVFSVVRREWISTYVQLCAFLDTHCNVYCLCQNTLSLSFTLSLFPFVFLYPFLVFFFAYSVSHILWKPSRRFKPSSTKQRLLLAFGCCWPAFECASLSLWLSTPPRWTHLLWAHEERSAFTPDWQVHERDKTREDTRVTCKVSWELLSVFLMLVTPDVLESPG